MLREPRFLVGLAAGGLLAWWWQRRAGGLVAGAPTFPRTIRRTPRRGGRWYGRARDTRPREATG